MATRKTPATNVELPAKERCTTILDNGTRCNEPRIRLNALKCTAHEKVYRAAAKVRAAERKAAAAKVAKLVATAPKRHAASNAAIAKVANVDAKGLRTTRPPRPARASDHGNMNATTESI